MCCVVICSCPKICLVGRVRQITWNRHRVTRSKSWLIFGPPVVRSTYLRRHPCCPLPLEAAQSGSHSKSDKVWSSKEGMVSYQAGLTSFDLCGGVLDLLNIEGERKGVVKPCMLVRVGSSKGLRQISQQRFVAEAEVGIKRGQAAQETARVGDHSIPRVGCLYQA